MKPTALVAAAAAVAVLATACSGGGDKTVATTQTPDLGRRHRRPPAT